jgi:phenylpyruvate tautomerase PptA (4-oxalocrotonate tautomerase family)
MPVVTIEIVADSDRPIANDLARAFADAVGRVLNSPPGQTWVRLRSLARNQYAENESPVDVGQLPVFVTILKRLPPSGAELQAEVTALTRAIAQVLDRPAACVHIEYAPAAIGRLSFGGELVE